MKLANLAESPYFFELNSGYDDWEVNSDYLADEHGENAILEYEGRRVMAIENDENDYIIRLYGGVSVTVDPEENVTFEIAVRKRTVLDTL